MTPASPCRTTALLSLLRRSQSAAAYTVLSALEAVAAVVCEPGSRSTDPILLHSVVSEAAELGRPLFQLFSHPASELPTRHPLNGLPRFVTSPCHKMRVSQLLSAFNPYGWEDPC